MNIEILCKTCGHLDFHHLTKPWGHECFSCSYDIRKGYGIECSINHKYVPDNLKYLEFKAIGKI
jgi:hypothetical protein